MEIITMMLNNMAAKEARERAEEQSERRITGNSLRDFRNALNVDQRMLAEFMGISVGRLGRLEHGKDCKDWNLLVRCCELALNLFASGAFLDVATAETWRQSVLERRNRREHRGRNGRSVI